MKVEVMALTLEQVKEKLYDLTEMFFRKATVIWEEQAATKPKLPYVTMKVSGIDRNDFPIEDSDERAYICQTKLEINLYTKGKPIKIGKNETGNCINTAMSDMMQFCDFVESDYGTDFMCRNDISIELAPPIRDLSELQNGAFYRYRSMAEFDVSFTEHAMGKYGVLGFELPDSSGGGSEEMSDADTETIERAEIEEI